MVDSQGSKREPPTIHLKAPPSYSHFLREHLQKNQPCLISSTLVNSWPAFSLWVHNRGDTPATNCSYLNLDYLRESYGDQIVSVAKCSSRAFSDQEREERPLRDVIDLWKSGNGKGLYVKDWHLAKIVRERGCLPFYETPQIFRDDWMNAFWEEEGKDDFRFVYMGVAGTFTPLHRDVCKSPAYYVEIYCCSLLLTTSSYSDTSYSWSTNITGTKIWHLFPPSVSHHLRRYPNRTSSEIVYDVRDVDLGIFKEFELARREMLVVEQPSGCTIFVPSGWYHQVENLTDTISINHNWCNINNLPSVYTSLLASVSDVEDALSDVQDLLRTRSGNPEWQKEWSAVVQSVLGKDSGWDWITFWRMVCMNMGQLKDPPLISDPVWPLTLSTLRPPFVETKVIVEGLVDDFINTRGADVRHIPGLSTILGTLRSILSS